MGADEKSEYLFCLDVANGKMYWANNAAGIIYRANLVGSGSQTLLRGLPGPLGIDLDVVGGKMYWADASGIRSANLDGSAPHTLLSGLPEPSGIALDLADGKIYWTDLMRGDRGGESGRLWSRNRCHGARGSHVDDTRQPARSRSGAQHLRAAQYWSSRVDRLCLAAAETIGPFRWPSVS